MKLYSHMMILGVVLGCLNFVGMNSEAIVGMDEDVKILAQFNGKNDNERLLSEMPESGVIMDRESWTQLWKSWRPNSGVPNADWSKEMFLVSVTRGPNRVRVNKVTLSDKGDLKLLAMSTKMGGPGFGYAFIKVPKANVVSVNGVALPAAAGGGAEADSITVQVVGTVETGIMAIGGETTGTLIRSNGITWELDLQRNRDLERAAKKVNGKRAKVSGQLKRIAGVEIAERWIVTVDSITALTDDVKPGKPAKSQFAEITITISGGFAGVEITKTITGDGKVSNDNVRERIKESWDMDPAQLKTLHALVGSTDWTKIPAMQREPGLADGFQYDISISTGKKMYSFSTDQMSMQKHPALVSLLKLSQNK